MLAPIRELPEANSFCKSSSFEPISNTPVPLPQLHRRYLARDNFRITTLDTYTHDHHHSRDQPRSQTKTNDTINSQEEEGSESHADQRLCH